MDAELSTKVWDADIEQIKQDVTDRLEEGRGVQTVADPKLPAAVSEMKTSNESE
jgi:hypothetical protein